MESSTTVDYTAALTTIKNIVTWVIDMVQQNAILLVFFVAGLIPVGIKIFKKLRKSVD